MWRSKGSIHDPKHTSSSLKQGGGSVIAWACMAGSGVGSLIFINDVTHDGRVEEVPVLCVVYLINNHHH